MMLYLLNTLNKFTEGKTVDQLASKGRPSRQTYLIKKRPFNQSMRETRFSPDYLGTYLSPRCI